MKKLAFLVLIVLAGVGGDMEGVSREARLQGLLGLPEP